MNEIEATPRSISWYRSPLDPKVFKCLHEKSDFLGWFQTLGFLSLFLVTGGMALYGFGRWPIGIVLIALFLHGTLSAFHINAVHELGHNTVFKTKALNAFFTRFFSFFAWMNFEMFSESHTRHHRYTLHQPDDLEVVLPYKVILRHMFTYGILNPRAAWWGLCNNARIAAGNFKGEWELKLFPAGSPQRTTAMNWARFVLVGHALVVSVAILFHLWMLPFLTSFAGCFGGCLQSLCNNTQHIGLQDDVNDFRLCCRTFTVNPFVQFLYWHMNYHIEHHMFAAVPCYRLGRLHRLIKHDLPPCPHGLVATWKEIGAIMEIQKANPEYQHVAVLPEVRPIEIAVA